MPNCRESSWVALLKTRRLFIFAAGLCFCLGGCAQLTKPQQICPGKATSAEAIATLQARLDRAHPLYINSVQTRIGYLDDKKKRRESPLPMKIWLEPPHNVYMRGQATPGPKGVISMGSNQEEFWLSIRPDINSYWWGKWSEVAGTEQLQISPQVVLEALGLLDLGNPDRWFLSNSGAYDVLSLEDDRGAILRRLHLHTCDYLPRKIEYFDRFGELLVLVELADYEVLAGEFQIPTRIQISNYAGDELTDWVKLKIKGALQKEFNDRFRQRYFQRQEPRGYDKVHRVTRNGSILEE